MINLVYFAQNEKNGDFLLNMQVKEGDVYCKYWSNIKLSVLE